MQFEILLSCMDEEDFSIIARSNIKTNALVINQCDDEGMAEEETSDGYHHRMLYTRERGLSRSRNMAIENSVADICLLADNDEYFYENLQERVLSSYKKNDADIIVFDLANMHKKLPHRITRLDRFKILKVSSWQISFKRRSIINANLWFDINLGSGTGNGGGEENKFLWDARKRGLKILYYPLDIGEMKEGESDSRWFSGFNEEYFRNRGAVTRYYMGCFWAFIYGGYFIISKYRLYKSDCSLGNAIRSFWEGYRKGISVSE